MAAPPKKAREAVVFDLDDTLVPWQTLPHWQWAWRPLGPALSERHTLSAIKRSVHAWDRRRWEGVVGTQPPADLAAHRRFLVDTLAAIAQRSLPDAETDAVIQRFLKPAGEIETFADVVPTLARLATEGIRVGVVTSLPEESARHSLKRVGLADLALLRAGEPDTEPRLPTVPAYRAIAASLQLRPSQILFVGDLFWSDIRAAARAGFATGFIDRRDWAPRVQRARIRSLTEVPELLHAPTAEPEPAPEGAGPDDPPA